MATKLVTVTNGLFFGRGQISATLAIRLIREGAAELDPAEGQKPEQVSRIRMTAKGYDDVAAKPTRKPRLYRSSETGAALSTVQREQLNVIQTHEFSAHGVIPVLKRYTNGRFVLWRDTDLFPASRFNPDLLPTSMFSAR